jgi:hypothetical protein
MKVGARSFDRLNSLRRPVLAALLATSAAISVQGCLPLMVGGTVMGSVAATWVGSLSPASIIAYC